MPFKDPDFVDEAFGRLVDATPKPYPPTVSGGMGPTTPRQALLIFHQDVCGKAREIMAAKNHDYASDADPFRNFRTFGRFGILVRMSDKLARLRSFEEQKKLNVLDESVADTCLDIINYAILYLGYEEK